MRILIKRIAILSLFFLSYGALLAHNMVPHSHAKEQKAEVSHHHHTDQKHQHGHEKQGEGNQLVDWFSDIVHVPDSDNSISNHTVSAFYKTLFSGVEFVAPVALSLELLFIPPGDFPTPFQKSEHVTFRLRMHYYGHLR
ncbi:MAG: hypothetical protein IPK96_08830 [Flammeovirgaceae bacterium]|nr:hypothetical protein [Flammeovirgaceae bacterium]